MTPIELLLSKLPDVKRNSRGWQARCPAHDDRRPSLSIAEGDDGRVLLHCHAGCSIDAICEKLGIRKPYLFPRNAGNRQPGRSVPKRRVGRAKPYRTRDAAVRATAKSLGGKATGIWNYHDENGAEVFWMARIDISASDKSQQANEGVPPDPQGGRWLACSGPTWDSSTIPPARAGRSEDRLRRGG